MAAEAPKRGRRRGLRRYLGPALLLAPVAVLPAVNLWLASPFGRAWIAKKIHQRCGLEARVAGASASPWNGIEVQGLEILQPPPLRSAIGEPLFKTRSVKLNPVWRAWLRGRTEIQAIDIDSPRAVVPVELLASLVRSHAAPASPAPAPNPQASGPAPSSPPEHPPAPPAPPTVTPPASSAIHVPPTGWLRIRNASFRLISASKHSDLIEVKGVNGDIPVSGSPARSKLRVAGIRIAGDETISGIDATLSWQAPILTLQPVETTSHGIKLTAAGQAALVKGLPVQAEIQAPAQALPPTALPADSRAEADLIASSARFRGFLLAPASWQGEWVAQSERIKFHAAGHDVGFDRGFMVTTLRGGVLSCNDARLLGDDLSLLGNATLIADGKLAGVLRVVAAPETAAAIGSRLIPNPHLTPLSTPQRVAVDLHASGNLQQLRISQGDPDAR